MAEVEDDVDWFVEADGSLCFCIVGDWPMIAYRLPANVHWPSFDVGSMGVVAPGELRRLT